MDICGRSIGHSAWARFWIDWGDERFLWFEGPSERSRLSIDRKSRCPMYLPRVSMNSALSVCSLSCAVSSLVYTLLAGAMVLFCS